MRAPDESRYDDCTPANVEVALVVPVNDPATTFPAIESWAYGLDVPIPTYPVELSTTSLSPLTANFPIESSVKFTLEPEAGTTFKAPEPLIVFAVRYIEPEPV